ncbi:MAG: DUF1272 domain-containing protein [Kiritimatiellia bacterium]|nr:DUF1272 domain-containing protein [Kiritimatiellia bacterium]
MEEVFHPAIFNFNNSEATQAYIRSDECTSCSNCAKEKQSICKSCGGDLQMRPKRTTGSLA